MYSMNVPAKFEVRGFTRSWDNKGIPRKTWAVPGYAHAPFSQKILIGFCLDGPSEYSCMTPQSTGISPGVFCGHRPGEIICGIGYIWCCIIERRKICCQFLQGTGQTYKTRCGGSCICGLFLISSGMSLPRISKIRWHLTKLWQI